MRHNYVLLAFTAELLLFQFFAVRATAQSPSFFPHKIYSSPAGTPRAIDCGDVNNDARDDLIVAGQGVADFCIFLGKGYGEFQPAIGINAGLPLYSVCIGDINNDNIPDLCMGSYASANSMEVYTGTGTGSFTFHNSYFYNNGAFDGVFCEMNADGKTDLVAVATTADTIGVRLNLGGGALGALVNYPVGLDPMAVVAADFNNDGKIDFATANWLGSTINVLLGNGAGGFISNITYPTGPVPNDVAAADLNNNGNVDIVTGGSSGMSLCVLMGNGTGAFPSFNTISSSPYITDTIVLRDFTGDLFVDIAATTGAGDNSVRVFQNDGAGGFPVFYRFGTGSGPIGVAAGDFDNNGVFDLAASNTLDNTISVLIAGATHLYELISAIPTGLQPGFVVPADFNNDGKADLAVANTGASTISCILGDGAGSSSSTITNAVNLNPNCIAVGDITNDGVVDALITTATPNISVRRGLGTGAFASLPNLFNIGAPNFVALGDMNADNNLDCVYATSSANTIKYRAGDGAGNFGIATATGVGAGPKTVVLADINIDGALDALSCNNAANSVSVLLGTGAGTFISMPDVPVGTAPAHIAIADMENDGAPDLVAANAGGNNISIKPGFGSGGFAPGTTIKIPNPVSVAIADVNHDGGVDIILTCGSIHSVAVIAGDGAGKYATPVENQVGSGTSWAAPVDFQRDGRCDVVATNTNLNNVAVLGSLLFIPNATMQIGGGTNGCLGREGIRSNSEPKINSSKFAFTCTGAPANSLGLLLVGDILDAVGTDYFSLLFLVHVDLIHSTTLLAGDFYSDSWGNGFAPVGIPNDNTLIGLNFVAQGIWYWPAAGVCDPTPTSFSSTRGLYLTIQP